MFKSAWLLNLTGENAPPAAHDSSEVLHAHQVSVVVLTRETADSIGV